MPSPLPGPSTKDRLLKAAMHRFSTQSYDTTTLRDLAADVGVDVAYAHRCYGSKEKLFAAALRATLETERVLGSADKLSVALAKEVVTKRAPGEIRPFDIAFRSFSSPDASQVLREILATDIIAPMTGRCPELSEMRAALVVAFLAGLCIFKDVIEADALVGSDPSYLERAVVQAIEGIISGDRTVIAANKPEYLPKRLEGE